MLDYSDRPRTVLRAPSNEQLIENSPEQVRRALGLLALNSLESKNESAFQFRRYQIEAWDSLHAHRTAGAREGLLHMATGLGKTTVIAGDIAAYSQERKTKGLGKPRVLFLAHQLELLRQAHGRLDDLLPDLRGVEMHTASGWSDDDIKEADIVYASLQSVLPRLEHFKPDEFDYVVVDESHHAVAPHYNAVIGYFKPEFRLGVTATPFRLDEKDLSTLFGETVYSKDLATAIAEGHLTSPDYRIVADDILDRAIDENFSSTAELNAVLFHEERNDEIAKRIAEAQETITSPRTIVFARSVEHASLFANILPEAKLLHSRLPAAERSSLIADFRSGVLPTIVTIDMFNEGVDIPEANLAVFLRNTASRTVFEQQLGRILRKTTDKQEAVVLDFVGNAERLEMLLELREAVRGVRPGVPRGDYEKHDRVSELDSEEEPGIFEPHFTERQIEIVNRIRGIRERAIKAVSGDYVRRLDLEQYYGIGRIQMDSLLEQLDIPLERFKENGSISYYLKLSDAKILQEYLDAVPVAAAVGLMTGAGASDAIGVSYATFKRAATKLDIHGVLARAGSGTIIPHYSLDDVEAVRSSFEWDVGDVQPGDVSLHGFARDYGRHSTTILSAAKSRGISPRRARNTKGKVGSYFSAEEVAIIKDLLPPVDKALPDYLNLNEIISQHNITANRARGIIIELGIEAMDMESPGGTVLAYYSPDQVQQIVEAERASNSIPQGYMSVSELAAVRGLRKTDRVSAAYQALEITPLKLRGANGRWAKYLSPEQMEAINNHLDSGA